METEKTFRIAGVVLRIRHPYEYQLTEDYRLYLTEENRQPDVVVEFVETKEIQQVKGVSRRVGFQRITCVGERIFRELLEDDLQTVYGCLIQTEREDRYRCLIYPNGADRFPYAMQVFRAISIEHILNRKRAWFLHAAYVYWRGRAILFCGPSGIGKSTQAKLWEIYAGAEVINGDRTILRKEGDIWYACGSPYSGSSRIFRNVTAPAAAIVLLEQAGENKIQRAAPGMAVRTLYTQTILHNWDRRYMEILMELLQDTIAQIPIYVLECRADEGAVRLLQREMEKENGIGTE